METRMRTLLPLTMAAAACLPVAGALAQEDAPPSAREETADRPDARLDPVLTDTSADETAAERLGRPAGGIEIAPVRDPVVNQVVPGLPAEPGLFWLSGGESAWVEAGTLRPEGTFLVGWVGEVVRLRSGGLAFLPAAEEGAARPEPPMGLLPCRTYARIESALGERERGLRLALTGEILQYHGRNWLLPTAFAPAPEAPPPPEPETADEDPLGPEGEAGAGGEAELDPVERMIRELEAEREARRGIDTTFPSPAPEEAAGGPGLAQEGRMLLSQRGRMVRSVEGGWVVVIDNDPERASLELPTRLRLLPAQIVEEMERHAEREGEGWTFQVTGRLFRYGANVYLLPRMYVSLPDDEVRALQ